MELRAAGWQAVASEKSKTTEIPEEPIKRGRGRAKDAILPSKTKPGQRKDSNTEYYSGEPKKK